MTAQIPTAERLHVRVDEADPFERGAQRGRLLRDSIGAALDGYDRLFALGGIAEADVREGAERSLEAIARFRDRAAREIEGIAAGAGVETWRITALNARTEILAASRTVAPGECSTIVRRADPATGTAPFGIQTWDWHVELDRSWHTLASHGGAHDVVGLTEHGILGKIGVNSAGVALHFNILGHELDAVGGVPMHVLAAIVLEEAESVAHARSIVDERASSASGSFALFDEQDAVLLDISPVGVFAVEPVEGYLLRTNHFLTPEPAKREKSHLYQPDSGERYGLLRERLSTFAAPAAADSFVPFLQTGPGQPAVTCVADPAKPLGQRWQSLATVVLEPARRTASIVSGTPVDAAADAWRVLRAA